MLQIRYYPSAKKSKNDLLPKKAQLKLTDILYRTLERVPTILCTFMEIFIDAFIYLLSSEKIIRKFNI